jgi:CheY-like chemotaxis protein
MYVVPKCQFDARQFDPRQFDASDRLPTTPRDKGMSTVLIVDDEEEFREILQVMLGRAGYHTMTAENGLEALQTMRDYAPDVVILDDMMPNMTGSEACLRAKCTPELRHIPIIIYTAGARVRGKGPHERLGANAVVYKPCLPCEIIEAVTVCLRAGV